MAAGLHLDDIPLAADNKWQGELVALEEFNERHAMRKITPYNFLRANRLFKRNRYGSTRPTRCTCYIIRFRGVDQARCEPAVLKNPYL